MTTEPPAPRRRGRFVPMAPAPAEGATPSRVPSRRRVYATRGLAASAAVLALSVQAGQAVGVPEPTDEITPCATCGDPSDTGTGTTA